LEEYRQHRAQFGKPSLLAAQGENQDAEHLFIGGQAAQQRHRPQNHALRLGKLAAHQCEHDAIEQHRKRVGSLSETRIETGCTLEVGLGQADVAALHEQEKPPGVGDVDHFQVADLTGRGKRVGLAVERFLGLTAANNVEQAMEARRQHAWVAELARHRDCPFALQLRFRVGTVVQKRPGERADSFGALGATPAHWRLLTTHAVTTLADARQITRFYRERWTIDIDQAWRLSRLSRYAKLRRFGRSGDRRRQAAPRWGRSANRSKRRDRRLIGVQQSELTSPDPNRAAG
jgi:hypothetical protein